MHFHINFGECNEGFKKLFDVWNYFDSRILDNHPQYVCTLCTSPMEVLAVLSCSEADCLYACPQLW